MIMPWYGVLPERWESHRLKMMVNDIISKANPQNRFYVGMENVSSWTARYIQTGLQTDGDCKEFIVGDVLFGKLRPYLAKIYVPSKDGVCSGEFLVLRGYKGNPLYLKYILLTFEFIMLVNASTYGAKMPRANWQFIGDCLVPLPPRDEQDQIVRYLDWKVSQINKLINAKRRQIELLGEQKRAVVNEALTRGSEGLETARLKNLCQQIGDIDHKMPEAVDNGIPYISPTNFIGNNEIDFDNCKKISQNSFNELSRKIRPNYGDIIFSRYATLGAVRIVKDSRDFLVSYSCVIIKPNERVLSEYLYYYLLSTAITNEIKNYSFETTQANIGIDSINRFRIMLPLKTKQHEIVAYLDQQCENFDRIVAKLNEEITLFAEYRTRLISDVVTGKSDVRGVVVPEYEAVDEIADDKGKEDEEDMEAE